MSTTEKERSKDITNFYRLCKDLFRYIKRKIIKKYVDPEMVLIKPKIINLEEDEESEPWKYYKKEEILTEEDKIVDIFKNNIFLSQVQKIYESLEIVILSLAENRKNYEFLKKGVDFGENKIKLLSELNQQLNQYFNAEDINSLNKNINTKDLNNINNKDVIDHLSLVKSFNILNDLKIINSINDINVQQNINNNNNKYSNTNITNNNIILDNKIINNNIQGQKENKIIPESVNNNINVINKDDDSISEDKKISDENFNNKNTNDNNKNETQNNSKKDITFLRKKVKRNKNKKRKKKDKYKNINDNNNINNSFSSDNSNDNSNNNSFNKIQTPKKRIENKNNNKDKFKTTIRKESNNKMVTYQTILNKRDEENNNEESSLNSLIDKINVSQSKESNEDYNNTIDEKDNSITFINKPNNSNNNIINNSKKNKDNSEIEFEKVLKSEFSFIYLNPKNLQSNNDTIREIKNILKKISLIKFPHYKNKIENPSLIGTHKFIDIAYLLDSIPAIDILFKCKDIKNIEEINDICEETLSKNLCLNYFEIRKGYDKENEIVKVINRCKIKLKNNYIFIYINLFFVNVNKSSYEKKEKCINRYLYANEIYNNKDKILICLFFRRWRRKYKLFFILPEFLDIIINFYYTKNESVSLIIENIFYDLFNGEINFYAKKDKIISDPNNINEIVGFIGEWYNNPDHKAALNNAIVSTNEFMIRNDYLSVVKKD